jgi:hypothetical protein
VTDESSTPWYKDPPKLIPVIVGCTVIATFVGALIAKIAPDPPAPPDNRVEYVVDVSRAMNGSIGEKAKLPAVAEEIIQSTEGRPDVATALRLAGGDCSHESRPPDVDFGTDNADVIREILHGARPAGKSNFANAVTQAVGDLRKGEGLTTILIIVGGQDTCSKARSGVIIRDALEELRDKENVKVNFKFVGVKVPKQVRKMLNEARKQARRLNFVAYTDYADRPEELPDVVAVPPAATPTPTQSPDDTAEPTP